MKNIFKNSGFRYTLDHTMLQPKNVEQLGNALGYLLEQEFEEACPILIATDTRPSSPLIKQHLIKGLRNFGHEIFDAGIAPTPSVAKALMHYQPEDFEDESGQESFFMLGIVITASHNPAEYNGIKILTPFGYLDEEMEEEISHIFHQFNQEKNITDLFPDEKGSVIPFDLVEWYSAEIIETFSAIRSHPSILLDSAQGATSKIAKNIFRSLGFPVTAINNDSNGALINTQAGCLNPELLVQNIIKNHVEWGIAFDGDGDRVIIAHKTGKIFDGDDIAAIISSHHPYNQDSVVVGTIMTNQGLQEFLQSKHKKLIRASVGERNVINELIKHQSFVGAETCGHVIMIDHALCSDGIFTALQFLSIIIQHPEYISKSLYAKYHQIHQNIPLHRAVNQDIIQKILDSYQSDNQTRIIIRPSNTEPVIRVMVESLNLEQTKIITQNILAKLKTISDQNLH